MINNKRVVSNHSGRYPLPNGIKYERTINFAFNAVIRKGTPIFRRLEESGERFSLAIIALQLMQHTPTESLPWYKAEKFP